MKQIILGTAGHIDHGKTSLIRTVTGINTDRLKEEQLRGITIELGFASMDTPGGEFVGIVDVPGHEKFVKNMVAGATGIDIVVMVIAADEGVMPQTREHMEICSLLGIQHGFIVLTKTDLVDEEFMELAMEDVRDFVAGTFLDGKPIIPFSSSTGEGKDEFIKVLDNLCREIPERKSSDLFRLPVDRVFTMKGFGTVITGSLISGAVKTGDTIMIYPSKITSKVRGIQFHNQSVTDARAGMRTAVNFQGLDKTSVNRGDVLSKPGGLIPSYMLDVDLTYLSGNRRPIKNRTRVRLHTGTSEVIGNLILLETEELAPGERTVAQIRLDYPVSAVRDDRFVIRSYSPIRTIGGGGVINPIPSKHKRFRPEVVKGLKSIVDAAPEDIVVYHAEAEGYRGVSFTELKLMTNLSDKPLEQLIGSLLSKQILVLTDRENGVYVHKVSLDKLKKEILTRIGGYHEDNPLKPGMPKEELKSKLPAFIGIKLMTLILNQLIKDGAIVQDGESVRLAGHEVSLGIDQTEIREKILNAYLGSGLTPPYFKDVVKSIGVDSGRCLDVLKLLIGEGRIVKVKEELYFDASAVEELKQRMTGFLKEKGEMTTPQFKDIAGVSRKYLIPLIEYFDGKQLTIRIGDVRKLRGGG